MRTTGDEPNPESLLGLTSFIGKGAVALTARTAGIGTGDETPILLADANGGSRIEGSGDICLGIESGLTTEGSAIAVTGGADSSNRL